MRALTGVLAFVVAFAVSADPATTRRWTADLQKSVELLKADQHAQALKLNNRLVKEMVEKLGPGDAATAAFALALTHKSLAHAGLGQRTDALWHWHTAIGLYPKLASNDLSMFGQAGALLMAHREPGDPSVTTRDTPKAGEGLPIGDVTPPSIIKRVEPRFPAAARYFGVEGKLVVEVVIDPDGTIRAPRIIQPLAPTLSYTALSAIRQWRFNPGKLNGKPVPVIFNLTVNFKLG